MYFNLTAQDIINSFSQVQESDFAVGNISGSPIILAEIAFQYEKLLNALPQEFIQMTEKVNGEVANVSVSGTFSPGFYAQPDTLRGYITDKGYSPCPGQSLEGTSMCWQNLNGQIITEVANIQSDGNNSYTLLDTFDYKTQNLTLYYDVDQDNLEIKSLKSNLRDMVCYSLGSRLFPVGQADVWSIVTYYGEQANKWLEYYQGGGMPAEYKKMKLLNKKSGISSIRVTRG